MLECKDIRPMLPDYAAGRLEEETAAQVADHLLLCPICAAELEALRAAQYQPAPVVKARSFATEDPLAGEKNTGPETEEAEAQTTAAVTEQADASEAAPPKKPRLRRRTKLLIALGALLVVGVCVGILHSRDFFSIRDWEKTGDESFAAVVYKGARAGEKEGFRVRLWNGKEKEWHDEVAFHDAVYRKLVWSPNGRFAAVEFTDAERVDRVFVIDINGLTTADLQMVLSQYLSRHEGYFGDVPLAAAPSCKILQWLPDSTRLLIAAEGVVDTNIDPDYGIELANSWSFELFNGNGMQTDVFTYSNTGAPTVSGYFAYDAEAQEIKNIVGFGQSSPENRIARLQSIEATFRTQGSGFAYGPNQIMEAYYDTDALLEIMRLPEYCTVQAYRYQPQSSTIIPFDFAFENWHEIRTTLTQEDGIILLANPDRTLACIVVIPSI